MKHAHVDALARHARPALIAAGSAGALAWFMPWWHFQWMGMSMHQNGTHIGGLAFLLLGAFVAMLVFAWRDQKKEALAATVVAALLAALYASDAATSSRELGFGLLLMLATAVLGLTVAVLALRSAGSDAATASHLQA